MEPMDKYHVEFSLTSGGKIRVDFDTEEDARAFGLSLLEAWRFQRRFEYAGNIRIIDEEVKETL